MILNWKNHFLKKRKFDTFENDCPNMPGNFYWKNKQGKYVGCNEGAVNVLQINVYDFIGRTDEELWPKQAAIIKKNDAEVMDNRLSIVLEQIMTAEPNEYKVFMVSKMPWLDKEGKILGTIGNLTDITCQKLKESALQKENEAIKLLLDQNELNLGVIEARNPEKKAEDNRNLKTEFLKNVRHDLRSPLMSIIGVSELLSRELDKNKIKKYTIGLAETCKELLRFLNESLEFIYTGSGEIPLLKKPFNLKELLENIVKLQQIISLEKELKLELSLDETIPKYLIGDPVRIYRVVLELVTNSLKFTNSGHVNIAVKLAKEEAQNIIIQIFVEDTGIGIPKEMQEKLFIRFKQPNSSHQNEGLGLSIVKEFIDDLGGEIYVESYLNEGTKFVCVIPLKKTLLEEPLRYPISFANAETVAEKYNQNEVVKGYGLIVEDQSIASLLAKTLFSEQGCEVDIVEKGGDALIQIQQHKYQFVLMDISLSDMDGYEVTRKIRLYEKSTGRHPCYIIGLSCQVDLRKKQIALEAGMNVILTKPLTREMIVNLMKNFISGLSDNRKSIENIRV